MNSQWLTPNEVLAALGKAGLTRSRSTLNGWVRGGLVCKPQRGGAGRGRGSYSLYPPEAVGEAAAAAILLQKGVSPKEVANIRKVVTAEYDLSKTLGLLPFLEGYDVMAWVVFATSVTFALMGAQSANGQPMIPEDGLPIPRGLDYLLAKDPASGWDRSALAQLWLTVRDQVIAGKGVLPGNDQKETLVLRRTERGTYRLAITNANGLLPKLQVARAARG